MIIDTFYSLSHTFRRTVSYKNFEAAPGAPRYPVVHLTNIRHRWLRARIVAGYSIYGIAGPRTIRTGRRTLFKYGYSVDESEAEAMQFIRDNTTVPVPAVRCVYKYRNITYIEMDFLPGEEAYIWYNMSSEAQESLLAELESYLKQIRCLVPPSPGLVASAYGDCIKDHRIGIKTAGPFPTHEDFHRFLRMDTDISHWDSDRNRKVVHSHEQIYLSKFTHGDLAPRNVLVHKGRISAIIDWDCAGWRPEYWEATKVRFGRLATPQAWFDVVDRASGGPYTLQLEAESRLWEGAECPSTPVKRVVDGRWQ